MIRRDFIIAVLLTWLAPKWARARPILLPLAKLKKLHEIGGSIVLKIKGSPLLLVRDSEKSIRAFNPTCTHEKCRVRYLHKKQRLGCKCHKSEFDLDGINLSGPAPRPLTTYKTELSGDRLLVVMD